MNSFTYLILFYSFITLRMLIEKKISSYQKAITVKNKVIHCNAVCFFWQYVHCLVRVKITFSVLNL